MAGARRQHRTLNFFAMKPGLTAQKFFSERGPGLSVDFLLALPEGYGADAAKRWPLILFLHGAGERGNDVWKATIHAPPKFDTQRVKFPFILVEPLCPAGRIWSDALLLALLDEVEDKYAVDTHRVYLTGISMGGFGTWHLGLSHPEKFAAIAPICGGGETILITLAQHYDADRLAQIQSLGVWAFHGGKDTAVAPEETVRMVNALKRAGCTNCRMTIYPEAEHDSWTQTYANPELFEWFLRHSR